MGALGIRGVAHQPDVAELPDRVGDEQLVARVARRDNPGEFEGPVHVVPRERRHHEESRQQLTALARIQLHCAASESAGVNFEREKTLFAVAANIGTQCAQGLDERFHRALSHLRDAIESIDPAWSGSAQRCEKSRRCPSQTHEQISAFDRKLATPTRDANRLIRCIFVDSESERAQRLAHQMRVLTE